MNEKLNKPEPKRIRLLPVVEDNTEEDLTVAKAIQIPSILISGDDLPDLPKQSCST